MTEGNPGSAGWAAFEARMRDRRFARCIEHARAGLETGTLDDVRDALDEARILCPGAPEIAEVEARIAALPTPTSVLLATHAPVQEPPAGWLRVAGAMAVLVLLFGLFGFGLAQLYLNPPAAILTDASPSASPAGSAPSSSVVPRATEAAATPEPSAPPPPAALPTREATESSAPTVGAAAGVAVGTTSSPAATEPAPRTEPEPARRAAADPKAGTVPTERREERAEPAAKPAGPAPRVTAPPAADPTTPAEQRWLEPPRPQPEVSRPVVTTPPSYEPPPAVNAVSRPAPVTDPVLPLEAPVLSPSASAPRVVPASVSREDESAQIKTLLSRYETAYNRLDAAAATSVWPGVDRAALDRAFRGLISQRVSLGLCDITVVGDVGGATCVGKARWEPKVGGGLQTADRYWTFNLRKANEGWRIEQVRVR